ncbi:hypothetical protein, partial [Halapricum sp. CBA1109]|uniref:hypothetical protein n=1 Tax=Halapricum sp. CBA1109 TaxID=2668068 RepID=UPI00351BBFF8
TRRGRGLFPQVFARAVRREPEGSRADDPRRKKRLGLHHTAHAAAHTAHTAGAAGALFLAARGREVARGDDVVDLQDEVGGLGGRDERL